MISTNKRNISSQEDAEIYLKEYLLEAVCGSHGYDAHRHDFDLYLPWIYQCLEGAGVSGGLSYCDLGVVLMDAAWALCQRGFIRPGPRSVMGEDMKADGKGYSLTPLGREWLKLSDL